MKCRKMVDNNIVWFGSIGKNEDGTAIFVEDRQSYADKQDGLVSSLTERLSVIQSELWYNVTYGLPLFNKVRNKVSMDASVVNIVESHPDVISILSFTSKVEGRTYHCKFQVESKFGAVEVQI